MRITWLLLPSLCLLSACSAIDTEYGKQQTSELVAERLSGAQKIAAGGADPTKLLSQSPLTLDNAVIAALGLNAGTRAAWAELEQAQAQLLRSTTPENPAFEAELRFRGGGIGVGSMLSLLENLVSLLKTAQAQKHADLAFASAQALSAGKMVKLASNVKKAYGNLYYANQVLDITKKETSLSQSSYSVSKEQRKAGNSSELQLAVASAEAAKANAALVSQEALTEKAEEELVIALGLLGRPASLHLSQHLPEIRQEIPSLKALISKALETRLDLIAARYHIEELGEKLEIANTYALVPRFDAGIQLGGEPRSQILVGPKFAFEIPIFDQGDADKRELGAELKLAQADYASLLASVFSEVRLARADLVAQKKIALTTKDHLIPSLRTALDESQKLYNGMTLGVFELIESKKSLLESEKSLLLSRHAAWSAQVALEEALGTNLDRVVE